MRTWNATPRPSGLQHICSVSKANTVASVFTPAGACGNEITKSFYFWLFLVTGGVEGRSEGQARRSGGSLGSFYSSTVELELFNYACVQTALAVRSSLTPFRLVGEVLLFL